MVDEETALTTASRITVGVMRRDELRFLLELWHRPEVMRCADELPSLRGWTKSVDPDEAWREHRRQRAVYGALYTQLIVRLPEGQPIGESFVAPLPEGYEFGRWRKPRGLKTVMGDLKLLPEYWGRGLGTEAMRDVVRWIFRRTECQLFVVPPHLRNPAAQRVYEKAGFEFYAGMRSAYGHRLMELSRRRYLARARPQRGPA